MKLNTKTYNLTGAGTEISNFNTNDEYLRYYIFGTAVAIGNYNISITGTPQKGETYIIRYRGTLDITTNGATFSILGEALTQNQLNASLDIETFYNGSSWEVSVKPSFTSNSVVDTANIVNDSVTNSKLADMANNTVKGNISGSSANPSDLSIPTVLSTFSWAILGNSGTSAGTNFIGTTDNIDLVFKRNSVELGRLDSTNQNITFGTSCASISGDRNSGFGYASLILLSTGNDNTAVGRNALATNTSGSQNTGVGVSSGSTTGTTDDTTTIGYQAISDFDNSIALGSGALTTAANQFAIPDSVTAIKWRGVSYTLPAADGTAGQKLTTDGAGNLTWA